MNAIDRLNAIHNGWQPEQPKNFIKTISNGIIKIKNFNNELHSFDDKPAIIYPNGIQYWCKNDKLHRDNDLPAIVISRSNFQAKHWFINGQLHRDNDLPAIILIGNIQQINSWYRYGQLYRDNNLPTTIKITLQ